MRRAKTTAAWLAAASFILAGVLLASPHSTSALAQPAALSKAAAFAAPAAPAVPAAPAARNAHLLVTHADKAHADLLPVRTGSDSLRLRAYNWALSQRGCWYVWGHAGPCRDGYDCSGLVMMAYLHAGVHLERTTYEMLDTDVRDRVLIPVRHPEKGDLAFYGSGHVELYARSGYTLGAHESGSPVSFIHYDEWWHPTAFYRVAAHR